MPCIDRNQGAFLYLDQVAYGHVSRICRLQDTGARRRELAARRVPKSPPRSRSPASLL